MIILYFLQFLYSGSVIINYLNILTQFGREVAQYSRVT